MVLCWAGSLIEAYELAAYLKDQATTADLEGIPELLEAYPKQGSIGEGPGKVQGVLFCNIQGTIASIDLGLFGKRRKLGRFDGIWLFGSGVYDAENFLLRDIQLKQGNLDPVWDALILMGHAMAAQASEGFGLDDYWGAGFQVLLPSENGFFFLDKILVRAWVATGEGASLNIARGPFFYYFYVQEMLMMCRLFGSDGGSLCSVPPLLKPNYECKVAGGEHKAEYVIDMVHQDESNGPTYVPNSYEPGEGPSVFVAPKGGYAAVSNAEMQKILAAHRGESL